MGKEGVLEDHGQVEDASQGRQALCALDEILALLAVRHILVGDNDLHDNGLGKSYMLHRIWDLKMLGLVCPVNLVCIAGCCALIINLGLDLTATLHNQQSRPLLSDCALRRVGVA